MPIHHRRSKLISFALTLGLLSVVACERKPEDLEKWRRAKGGMQKMVQWAKDKKEPMPVRERAVQILIEQGEVLELQPLFSSIKDEADRQALASAAVPLIEKMWATQDMTRLSEAKKNDQGDRVVTGIKIKEDAKSVYAKDAAYYLAPYVKPADKPKLESILGAWLAEDHLIRDTMGKASLGQIVPRAGDKGMEGVFAWFNAAKDPVRVAEIILREADDKTRDKFAGVVVKKLEAAYPDKLNNDLEALMLMTQAPSMVPFAKKLVLEGKASGGFTDAAMDVVIKQDGPKATMWLDQIIRERTSLMRAVAMTRMINVRGEGGVLPALNALPLEIEKYAPVDDKDNFEGTASYFCNVLEAKYYCGVPGSPVEGTSCKEDEKFKGKKPDEEVKRMVSSTRWPVQVVGMACVKRFKLKALKPQVEALKESAQVVPGHAEGTTIGALATKLAEAL